MVSKKQKQKKPNMDGNEGMTVEGFPLAFTTIYMHVHKYRTQVRQTEPEVGRFLFEARLVYKMSFRIASKRRKSQASGPLENAKPWLVTQHHPGDERAVVYYYCDYYDHYCYESPCLKCWVQDPGPLFQLQYSRGAPPRLLNLAQSSSC